MAEVGEETVAMPKYGLINQYTFMGLMKGETEDVLAAKIAEHEGKLFIKAIYFSPTSNMHVAYVLSNESLTEE